MVLLLLTPATRMKLAILQMAISTDHRFKFMTDHDQWHALRFSDRRANKHTPYSIYKSDRFWLETNNKQTTTNSCWSLNQSLRAAQFDWYLIGHWINDQAFRLYVYIVFINSMYGRNKHVPLYSSVTHISPLSRLVRWTTTHGRTLSTNNRAKCDYFGNRKRWYMHHTRCLVLKWRLSAVTILLYATLRIVSSSFKI